MLRTNSVEYTKLSELEVDQQPAISLADKQKQWQTNIQGLRGIAILAIFLFHAWPKRFDQCYLGVDVFFVISGFIMSLLLNVNAPLNSTHIVQFYFRRIKRIVPTYLFVIASVLVLSMCLISYTDYWDLANEAKKPLFFIANWPDTPDDDYFAETADGYFYFLHLWSLSVELQFYLFVPFVVFALHRLTIVLQLLGIFALTIMSFCFQSTASKDVEHMSLVGRIWQFMFGFIAWYLQFYVTTENKANASNEYRLWFLRVFKAILPIALVSLLVVPITSIRLLNRLLVILLTAMNIGLAVDSIAITNRVFTKLGDYSYSIYLVHWPLYEYYHYKYSEREFQEKEMTLEAGLVLMALSTTIGCLVEILFKRFNSILTSWWRLILIICLMYSAIAIDLRWLKQSKSTYKLNRSRVPPNAWTIYRNAIEVYDDRETNHLKLSLSTVQKYIKKFGEANFHPNWYCNTTELPTAYSRLNELNQRYCTVTGGNGTKVIVVIGDSHSTTYVPGIIHNFREIYSNITLINRNFMLYVGGNNSLPQYYKWPNERKSILPILREFNYPIDILIVGQCYDNSDPPLDSRNITQDSIYREMITFYVELSKIAREIVLIPGVQFDSKIKTFVKVLHRNLVLNENMKMFRLPYNYIARQKPNTRRRLAAVKCPKCVVVKWEDLWCKKREGYCDAVDQHHRLPFFWDQHHPSLYGSMFVGSYLRRIYDNQMMKQSNVSL